MQAHLSKNVLNHILSRHPEVVGHVQKITQAILHPDLIALEMKGELKALKFYRELDIGPKFLIVLHREVRDEKVIITAYFTSNVNKVKGKIVWKRSQ